MWGLLEGATVVELTLTDPAGRFHKDLNWVAVPDGTALGARLEGGSFVPPAPRARSVAHQAAVRDELLRRSDWTMLPDAPLTADQVAAWRAYRTALRNLPQQPGWPAVTFPDAPAAAPASAPAGGAG